MGKSKKKNSLNKQQFTKSGVELSIKQDKLYKGIRSNILTTVHGPAGTSKAQPMETPVLTPNGWSRMGDLKLNDNVISKDGKPTRVIGIFPQGKKEIWEISFSDGTKTECCGDHLWLTQTEKDRSYRKWTKTTNGIRKRYKSPLDGTVKTTTEIVETLYTKRNRINHTIPITEPVEFNKIDIDIDPYVIGCLIGDGCLRGSIGFTSVDSEIIETIKNSIDDGMNLVKRNDIDYCITKNISEYKNRYKQYLIKIGLFGKLSYQKFIPNCYKFNSITNRIELLRGLMDTDGTVSKDGFYVSFTSTSKKLTADVIELVQSLGGTGTYHTPVYNKYTYNGELKTGRLAYTISIKMNPNINPFKLKRKKDLVVPKTKYIPRRHIVGAKLIGKKEAQCIKVDSESSLYLTNDYIVTHNTFTTCYAALGLLADKKIETIIITKPIQESGENLGALPGDKDEKLQPYKQSYYTTFVKIIGKETTDELFENDEIIFEPLAYMRGSTYDNCIMLLDECQNVTIKQLMLWVTRLGTDSKAVMMGDTSQYDVRKRDSGYNDFMEMISGMSNLFPFEFLNEDIVRNKFLIELTNRYDKYRFKKDI